MAPFLIAPGNRQQTILCVDIGDRRFFRRDDLDETAFVPRSLLWLACCLYASIAAAAVIRLEPARVFDGEALQEGRIVLLEDSETSFAGEASAAPDSGTDDVIERCMAPKVGHGVGR